jgi:hypothetical protein
MEKIFPTVVLGALRSLDVSYGHALFVVLGSHKPVSGVARIHRCTSVAILIGHRSAPSLQESRGLKGAHLETALFGTSLA